MADLQVNLKQEQIIVEEKKSKTQAIIETIGQEKAIVDQAVEAGREDEEAASKLAVWTLYDSTRLISILQYLQTNVAVELQALLNQTLICEQQAGHSKTQETLGEHCQAVDRPTGLLQFDCFDIWLEQQLRGSLSGF